jgi:hypothetical protein
MSLTVLLRNLLMLHHRSRWAAGLCSLTLVLTASSVSAQFADLEGQIILDGEIPTLTPYVMKDDPAVKDTTVCAADDVPNQNLVVDAETMGVANVIIWVKKPTKVNPELAAVPSEPIVQDQKQCVFIPHVQIVRCGQTILATSQDPVIHNMKGDFVVNGGFNIAIGANETDGIEIPGDKANKKPEIVPSPVACNVHPHMKCYWLVVDHPYAAITDAQGRFKITGLPVGKNVLTIWHEGGAKGGGYIHKTLEVTVAEDGTILDAMKVQATVEEGEFRKLVPVE